MRYSPKKIKTKFIDPNSTLKPETNSDSPSIKSKGTLEVSHNTKIKKKKNNKIKNKKI